MTTAEVITAEADTTTDTAYDANLRGELHELVNLLASYDLHSVRRYMAFLIHDSQHPAIQALQNAPSVDEPLTEEDIAALKESDEDERAGRIYSREEVKRRLGLR
ncbi:MAG: hypothetical protein O3A46_00720 [Candidatus Poribacteria bacterium]|nr:hypothetical protein [Candidatus Poribacteria bacterium]